LVFIYLDLKEEDKWVVQQLPLKRIRKEQYLQEYPTKANYLSVIGQLDQPMKQEVKIKL
jgi:hypothetical protein